MIVDHLKGRAARVGGTLDTGYASWGFALKKVLGKMPALALEASSLSLGGSRPANTTTTLPSSRSAGSDWAVTILYPRRRPALRPADRMVAMRWVGPACNLRQFLT